MGNCKKIKKTINGNDFTYKCIKFYVYKIKPETLKFVVVVMGSCFVFFVCLFVCFFRFVYYYYYYFFRTLNFISLGITCYHLNDIVSYNTSLQQQL